MISREEFLKEKRKIGIDNLKIALHMLKRTYQVMGKDAGVNTTKINSVFNLSRNYEESEWVQIFKTIYSYLESDQDLNDKEFITKKVNEARQLILYFDQPEEISIESLNYINPTGEIPSNKLIELLESKERLIYFIGEIGSGNSFVINQSIRNLKKKKTDQIHIPIDLGEISTDVDNVLIFINNFIKEVIKIVRNENSTIKLKYADYDVSNTISIETPLRILMSNLVQSTNNEIYLWLTGVDYLYKYFETFDLVHSFLTGLVAGAKNADKHSNNGVNIIFSFNILLEDNSINKHIISSLITSHAWLAFELSLWNSEAIKKILRVTGTNLKEIELISEFDEIKSIENYNEKTIKDQYRTISKNIAFCFNGVASITSLILYYFHTNKIDIDTLIDLEKCKNLTSLPEIESKIVIHNKKCNELAKYYSIYLKAINNQNQLYKIDKLKSIQINL